jgi:hypothetical protein
MPRHISDTAEIEYSYLDTPEEEVSYQEQEVFHFRAVERFIPEERSYE